MCQPVARDRIAERAHHRILPDQLGKGLRAVFAGEDAVGPRGRGGRGRLGQVHAQHRGIVGVGIAHGSVLGVLRDLVEGAERALADARSYS